jgi:hypothetical protein
MNKQEPLLVDKGCAERGCMGYDSRDGDAPVEMSIHRPWRGLTDEERDEICLGDESIARAVEAKLKELNT